MLTGKVIILGCARDLGQVLTNTIARIEQLGLMFQDYEVVIYENDSVDLTKYALKGWEASNPKVKVISEEISDPINPPTRCLKRMERMAKYRNRLREEALKSDADYVIVLDMDLPGGWSYDGIASTFARKDWDCVGSNGIILKHGKALQYDAWAFREIGNEKPLTGHYVNAKFWERGDDWLPIYSVFGGLAVYRMPTMRFCYDGSDCEHVAFHRRMRNNGMGRIYLNPAQLVLYSSQDEMRLWSATRYLQTKSS